MPDTPANDVLSTRWSMLERLDNSRSEESWRWFIGRYREFVLEALRKTLGDRHEARRAGDEFWGYLFTSDVFAHADRAKQFRAFLAGTVRNFARDWRERNRSRASELPTDADPPVLAELAEHEELRIWARTVLSLCLRALRDSHPRQAEVLCWFYGIKSAPDEPSHPVSTSEIATRLGARLGAVHQHLSRGRRHLRELLESEIRATVRDPDDLETEFHALVGAMLDATPGLIDH